MGDDVHFPIEHVINCFLEVALYKFRLQLLYVWPSFCNAG